MFKRSDKLAPDFLTILDHVLAGCGWVPQFTSDARTREEEQGLKSSGGAVSDSLHIFDETKLARAVDIRYPRLITAKFNIEKVDAFLDSVYIWRKDYRTELELDVTANNAHIHFGVYPATDKRPSHFLVRS